MARRGVVVVTRTRTMTYASVDDFGADPSGAADSSQAFNDALATGLPVYFVGSYRLAASIDCTAMQAVSLRGLNPDRSVLRPDSGVTAIRIGHTATAPPVDRWSRVSDFAIAYTGSQAAHPGSVGVLYRRTRQWTVKRVRIDLAYDGIRCYDAGVLDSQKPYEGALQNSVWDTLWINGAAHKAIDARINYMSALQTHTEFRNVYVVGPTLVNEPVVWVVDDGSAGDGAYCDFSGTSQFTFTGNVEHIGCRAAMRFTNCLGVSLPALHLEGIHLGRGNFSPGSTTTTTYNGGVLDFVNGCTGWVGSVDLHEPDFHSSNGLTEAALFNVGDRCSFAVVAAPVVRNVARSGVTFYRTRSRYGGAGSADSSIVVLGQYYDTMGVGVAHTGDSRMPVGSGSRSRVSGAFNSDMLPRPPVFLTSEAAVPATLHRGQYSDLVILSAALTAGRTSDLSARSQADGQYADSGLVAVGSRLRLVRLGSSAGVFPWVVTNRGLAVLAALAAGESLEVVFDGVDWVAI